MTNQGSGFGSEECVGRWLSSELLGLPTALLAKGFILKAKVTAMLENSVAQLISCNLFYSPILKGSYGCCRTSNQSQKKFLYYNTWLTAR